MFKKSEGLFIFTLRIFHRVVSYLIFRIICNIFFTFMSRVSTKLLSNCMDDILQTPVSFLMQNMHKVLFRRTRAARLLISWARIPRGHACLSAVSVACCQVEVSATT
jgi:hypothetical protein